MQVGLTPLAIGLRGEGAVSFLKKKTISTSFQRKKYFFYFFSISKLGKIIKKKFKKIFFSLKTGRNRFFDKNETAFSPLNPMLTKTKISSRRMASLIKITCRMEISRIIIHKIVTPKIVTPKIVTPKIVTPKTYSKTISSRILRRRVAGILR